MENRKIRIVATGKYLPEQAVSDAQMDKLLNAEAGWTSKIAAVGVRYFVAPHETAVSMGVHAAQNALAAAGLTIADIDCLVCASGTKEQPLPSTASLLHYALGMQDSGAPAFDIDATCLSFLTALDLMSYPVLAGKYKHVMIVSSEIASRGINYKEKESAALFGDGAAAVIITAASANESSCIVRSHMETYSEGARFSEIAGGGSRLHASNWSEDTAEQFLFHMNGQGIFRMASRLLPEFMDRLLGKAGMQMSDFKAVIPHQGSALAMKLICQKLGITNEQLVNITHGHGNTIAASLPMGLHEAISSGQIKRGDRLLLLGTAAGLSLGGMILDY